MDKDMAKAQKHNQFTTLCSSSGGLFSWDIYRKPTNPGSKWNYFKIFEPKDLDKSTLKIKD